MIALKLIDIKKWLIENRREYEVMKAQEFPPFDNEVYWMYNHLHNFIEYYPYSHKCDEALKELKALSNCNFSQIIKWTKTNEVLGSQQLLMFEVDYIEWSEDINEPILKIHKGLYTERKPFDSIIYFCKIFQLLYWDNNVHENNLSITQQKEICKDLQKIFDDYYLTQLTND